MKPVPVWPTPVVPTQAPVFDIRQTSISARFEALQDALIDEKYVLADHLPEDAAKRLLRALEREEPFLTWEELVILQDPDYCAGGPVYRLLCYALAGGAMKLTGDFVYPYWNPEVSEENEYIFDNWVPLEYVAGVAVEAIRGRNLFFLNYLLFSEKLRAAVAAGGWLQFREVVIASAQLTVTYLMPALETLRPHGLDVTPAEAAAAASPEGRAFLDRLVMPPPVAATPQHTERLEKQIEFDVVPLPPRTSGRKRRAPARFSP